MTDHHLISLEEAARQRKKASRCAKASSAASPDDDRRVVRLTKGKLKPIVDEIERALIDANVGVFQRANRLVGIGAVPVITSDERHILTRQILPLGEHRVLELVMSAVRPEKFDGRTGGFVATDLPMTVIKALEQRRGHFRLWPLSGLLNGPTLRSDGSVLAESGYDMRTGLYLAYDHTVEFPPVPDAPTREDAEVALRVIEDLLASFPFHSAADKSVAVATILTACVRRSLRTAPAFVFTAPVPGSGKSKLVDVANVIASGYEAGVISAGKDPGETEKRIAALLLSGSPIAIDNVEGGLSSDLLCQILTQVNVKMRILGKSETPELPTNVLVTVTGNNISIVGDLTRRSLLCRLDPKTERPELREFPFEPVEKAKAERGTYLVAALTILRAFHVAGCPQSVPVLGSFEDWSRLVRGALLWLKRPDPNATMDAVRRKDPRLDELRTLMAQWWTEIGSDRVTANEVIRRATEKTAAGFGADDATAFRKPDFREALLAVAANGALISSKKLGSWLADHEDRIVAVSTADEDEPDAEPLDLYFHRDRVLHGVMTWRLDKTRDDKTCEPLF